MHKILIVDNETILTRELTKSLSVHNYCISTARTIQECQDNYYRENFHLIITELRLPDGQGTDLITLIPDTPTIIITSYASLRSAVDAMQKGAVDYLPKPFDHNDLVASIQRTLTKPKNAPITQNTRSSPMIGDSKVMQNVFKIIRKVAVTDAAVLINGPPGTGKELAAQRIHQQSQRRHHPFISVNCAAIPQTALETELFGEGKSNHCGLINDANHGTLYLKEVHELPLETQAKLLRTLQEGRLCPPHSSKQTINLRLITTSSRDLQQLCVDGLFREELYYQIHVVDITLPPLRERESDVLTIANTLLGKLTEKLSSKLDNPHPQLNKDAIKALTAYCWPGNIRELENALQRAVILCDKGEKISPDLLGINLATLNTSQGQTSPKHHNQTHQNAIDNDPPEGLSLEDYFTRFVLENQSVMSETALAKKLGISRKCLWERRQKLNLPRRKNSGSEQSH